jgi:hypothetical protein
MSSLEEKKRRKATSAKAYQQDGRHPLTGTAFRLLESNGWLNIGLRAFLADTRGCVRLELLGIAHACAVRSMSEHSAGG